MISWTQLPKGELDFDQGKAADEIRGMEIVCKFIFHEVCFLGINPVSRNFHLSFHNYRQSSSSRTYHFQNNYRLIVFPGFSLDELKIGLQVGLHLG